MQHALSRLDKRIKTLICIKVTAQITQIILAILWLSLLMIPAELCVSNDLSLTEDGCKFAKISLHAQKCSPQTCFEFELDSFFDSHYLRLIGLNIGFLFVTIICLSGYIIAIIFAWTITCPLLDVINTVAFIILTSTTCSSLLKLNSANFVLPKNWISVMVCAFLVLILAMLQTVISYMFVVAMQMWSILYSTMSDSEVRSSIKSDKKSKETPRSSSQPKSILKKPSSFADATATPQDTKDTKKPLTVKRKSTDSQIKEEKKEKEKTEISEKQQSSNIYDLFSIQTMMPNAGNTKHSNVYSPYALIKQFTVSSLDYSAPDRSLTVQSLKG